jgi:hypothetical protein
MGEHECLWILVKGQWTWKWILVKGEDKYDQRTQEVEALLEDKTNKTDNGKYCFF